MAYFPNGSSLERFEREVCSGCVHRSNVGKECPVIEAHVFQSQTDDLVKVILNLLVPASGRTCAMFHSESK